jgi:hypothetical protein
MFPARIRKKRSRVWAPPFEGLLAETIELLVDGVDDLDGDDGALRQVVHNGSFSWGSLYSMKNPRFAGKKPSRESVSTFFANQYLTSLREFSPREFFPFRKKERPCFWHEPLSF